MKEVIKRDGRVVPFDQQKVVIAVESAMSRTNAGIDHALSTFIAQKVDASGEQMHVEQIQDLVENLLMNSDRKEVAKEYILYRAERTRIREHSSSTMQDAFKKISGTNIENSNANVDEASFGGRKNEASSVIQKQIALDWNMSPDVAAAHRNGLIYQHDLDSYNVGMHNCLFADIAKLFHDGFSTRNGDVRPPTSFSTACQLLAVIFQLQSQDQFGGVASAHVDRDLAPFVAMSFKKHFKEKILNIVL